MRYPCRAWIPELQWLAAPLSAQTLPPQVPYHVFALAVDTPGSTHPLVAIKTVFLVTSHPEVSLEAGYPPPPSALCDSSRLVLEKREFISYRGYSDIRSITP